MLNVKFMSSFFSEKNVSIALILSFKFFFCSKKYFHKILLVIIFGFYYQRLQFIYKFTLNWDIKRNKKENKNKII